MHAGLWVIFPLGSNYESLHAEPPQEPKSNRDGSEARNADGRADGLTWFVGLSEGGWLPKDPTRQEQPCLP